jgi:hypothetical protein
MVWSAVPVKGEVAAVGIYQHPRMLALRKKQTREAGELYDAFLRLHPELDGHVDHDDWTPPEDAAFRKFADELLYRHQEEQRALVGELGGKLSPLSQFELAIGSLPVRMRG